jgi:type IV pilus assembly protein PilW
MKSQPNLTTPAGSGQGFTLVELLVAMAISALVMTAIYATFKNQQGTYILHELVASAQQNLRAGMLFMEREIRMAGCDPLGSAGAGINTANANSISFTLDYRNADAFSPSNVSPSDGDLDDPNENITYVLATDTDDDNKINLYRTIPGDPDPPPESRIIAENIEALDFVYLDGASPTNVLNPGRTDITDAGVMASIRSVQITMVAVAARGLPGYLYTNTHSNQQGVVIYGSTNNNINSRAMTVTINARNLGL